jgi:hypothetical protein
VSRLRSITAERECASTAGFPDVVMTRRGPLAFVEVKSERGKLRPEQVVWLDALRLPAAEPYWTPVDWPEDRTGAGVNGRATPHTCGVKNPTAITENPPPTSPVTSVW